jgi:hypothetical protein
VLLDGVGFDGEVIEGLQKNDLDGVGISNKIKDNEVCIYCCSIFDLVALYLILGSPIYADHSTDEEWGRRQEM